MKLRLINTYERNPWYNLAVENAALEAVGADEVLLYLWQNQRTVVIGKGQNPWRECRVQLLDKEGGLLARRSSGGGAVYHDMGNLNFSFIAGKDHYDLHKQLQVLVEACRAVGIEAAFSGRNDLLVEESKFSGNAFRNMNHASLHHGTIMVNVDVNCLGRYLMPSEAKLESKGVESVRSRVCNLSTYAPSLTTDGMRILMAEAFGRVYGGQVRVEVLDDWSLAVQKRIRELYVQYASWQWRFGQTMHFNASLETRFSWGGMALDMRLAGGMIDEVYVDTDCMEADMSDHIKSALLGGHYGPELPERLLARAAAAEGDCQQQIHQVAEWLLTAL